MHLLHLLLERVESGVHPIGANGGRRDERRRQYDSAKTFLHLEFLFNPVGYAGIRVEKSTEVIFRNFLNALEMDFAQVAGSKDSDFKHTGYFFAKLVF